MARRGPGAGQGLGGGLGEQEVGREAGDWFMQTHQSPTVGNCAFFYIQQNLDANIDGSISAADARFLLRCSVGLETANAVQTNTAATARIA